jgi:hypothetical protein
MRRRASTITVDLPAVSAAFAIASESSLKMFLLMVTPLRSF